MQKLSIDPAADPAAQLVELGQAEQVGPLDHHHRGVGDVDPDLDHGGGDEHVDLPLRNCCISARPLGDRQLAVDALDAVAVQLARAQLERLGLGRGGLARLRLGHERADDVGLAALAQQPPHALEHLLRGAPRAQAG